jgi:hypothetical protein
MGWLGALKRGGKAKAKAKKEKKLDTEAAGTVLGVGPHVSGVGANDSTGSITAASSSGKRTFGRSLSPSKRRKDKAKTGGGSFRNPRPVSPSRQPAHPATSTQRGNGQHGMGGFQQSQLLGDIAEMGL